MRPEDFVHLHVHSHYSLLEALPSPKALVKRAKEQGMTTLALTDNGAMYGAVEFFQACKNEGIKPIIGLDAYMALNLMTDKRHRIDDRPYRLVLLAKNETGYKNLLKITTAGFVEGFYYKPRIDKPFLEKHKEGLIALSGSIKGEIPTLLQQDNYTDAEAVARWYADLFGEGNFYLELVHQPDSGEQTDINERIVALSKKTGIPLVAARTIHYLNPEDRNGYEAQLCIQRGRTLEDFRRTNTDELDLSFGTPDEIIKDFAEYPEAIENTKKIADEINFEMDLGHNYLPIFEVPGGKSDNEYLRELTLEGIKERYGENPSQEVMERFEFEYQVITKMGYSSYFIIVQDFVNFAKREGILVGPGRGSAAGSLISYALKITDLDPLKYGLLFERFLNPDRVSMPDVDMDFADSRRGEVLKYVRDKYGEDKVAGIITFGTMKPKAAVRDAARVLGLSFQEADVIAKAVPDPVQGRHTPLAVARVETPELKELLAHNPMAREVVDLAMKIEGNPRHASQHACGFVIGDLPLVERAPLQEGQREDTKFVVQYSLNSAESAGLVKMDFLGLSNLTIIEQALEIIEAVNGDKVDIEHIPLDDKETFELLGRGETTGVFQLESDGMKRYIKDLKPTEFEDIVAMVSLYRPGPLSAGMVPQYINRKNGREKVVYDHPLMEPILKETYGVTVYQEQIMKVSRVLAGFTAGQADTLRKAMGKKKRDVLDKMKDDFVKGCEGNGVSAKIAEKVWHDWEGFADYAFNKSHAACYAMISYRTAYLKAHYPSEFMAAVMNSDITLIDRITIEVEECTKMGITVLPPDVNESYPGFSVVPDTTNIRWGLGAVKNCGFEAGRAIQQERKKNGPYKSFGEFLKRLDTKTVNRKNMEALIKAGAFDRFGSRSQLLGNLDQAIKFHKQSQKEASQNQLTMFDLGASELASDTFAMQEVPELPQSELLNMEREMLGIYISSHPTRLINDAVRSRVQSAKQLASMNEGDMVKMIGVVTDIKRILTKAKQEPMAFVRVDDWTGSFETVIFPKTYVKVRDLIIPNQYMALMGKVSWRDRGEEKEVSVLVDKIISFTEKEFPAIEDMIVRGIWHDDGLPRTKEKFEKSMTGVVITLPEQIDPALIASLREVFAASPGREPIYLKVKQGDSIKTISTEYAIDPTARNLQKIADLVGPDRMERKGA